MNTLYYNYINNLYNVLYIMYNILYKNNGIRALPNVSSWDIPNIPVYTQKYIALERTHCVYK